MKLLSDIFQNYEKAPKHNRSGHYRVLACVSWKCPVQFQETLQEDAVIWIYSEGQEYLPGSEVSCRTVAVTLTTGQTAGLVSRHELHY